jgi:hypothetical protein
MNTQTKIAAALLLVLIAALTTTAALSYFIYERTLSGLVTSRFEFIAEELKRKIEASLDLGLPLGELENMSELLRQEMLTDDALVGLTIQNTRGIIVFDTDASRIGAKSASPWLEVMTRPESKRSDISIQESNIGVPLVNSFGKVTGGLLVSFSKAYYDDKRAGTIGNIVEITLIVLLLSSFIGLCGVLTISRPLEYALVRLEASLRAILVRVGLSGEDASAETDVESEVVVFERNLLNAVAALERAEKSNAMSGHAVRAGHL